ncbi:uncharacterized protein LOC141600489 [Silene latifolia]|uniref:uncharacterized protein LOC141600489 n=1 Tax=Silene latifolia TaxID=37657 RepID=UPI003D77C0BB
MYTTKSLTRCKKSRNTLSQLPEGPNSGYLVIEDEDDNTVPTYNNPKPSKKPPIISLPFPQNKLLTIDGKDDEYSYRTNIYLIPVVNQPLSSNLYYVIETDGKHEGKAYASTKEEDKQICCFCIPCIIDFVPRAFNPRDIYQQFEFSVTKTPFNTNKLLAASAAPDGHPPIFLRRYDWEMRSKPAPNFTLKHVSGLNPSLRAQLPDFNFPISEQCSKPVVVGTWYCPFMFIKEESEKERVKYSAFYEMTLEQRWERVFSVENNGYGDEKNVTVDVVVQTRVGKIGGEIAVGAYGSLDKEVVWFKSKDKEVGLSKLIMDRIIWEEERVGWVRGNQEKELRVVKEEVYEGVKGWRNFGCYVLVESFVLKRNNGSIVMTYDFMHAHQLRSKWE